MVKEQLQAIVEEVLRELDLGAGASVHLETPRDRSHGDFSTNVALALAKPAGLKPRDLAERIVARLAARPDFGAEASVAGPGFINFKLGSTSAAAALRALLAQGPRLQLAAGPRLRIQVEFVSANPTGPLNVVNARAAAYGSTLAAILRASGHDVESEFYVNDAGRQVELLGWSLRARLLQRRGQDVAVPEDGYQGDYVRDMAAGVDAARADAWLRLEPRAAALACGEFAVETLLAAQKTQLERFGVRYERWFRESELHTSGAVEAARTGLEAAGHTYRADGALFFRSTTWGDDKDRVLVRSDGAPTYFLADAAYHRDKHERGFRHVIDVWGPDHHAHITRMQAVARAFGYPQDWLEVVIVQWVKLIEAGEAVKMSKRAGQMVTLGDLLDEVGVDVAKYFFLMRQDSSHLDFDLDLARKQSDENPVFYVKYAHARICSVIRKAAEAGLIVRLDAPEAAAVGAPETSAAGAPWPHETALERLDTPEEHALVKHLVDYPDLVRRAGAAREPHRLTGFCETLARSLHRFWHERRIIQDDHELALARLALCHATRRVLASALGLMSIEAPRSM
jgi:arginyl-tRNA synthetase